MTGTAFDCRTYDLNAYATEILKNRVERFSTVYSCCFVTSAETLSACGGTHADGDGRPPPDMLLAASSTGEIKLYLLPDLVQRWTAGQQSGQAVCSWRAHRGAVYCMARARAGSDVLLFSGGDDGYVRGWRLSDVMRHLQQQQQQQQPPLPPHHNQQQQPSKQQPLQPQQQQDEAMLEPGAAALRPCLAVRLPRAESPLAAISLPPAVQALAVAGEAGGGGSGELT
ncbi:hypothetical protein Agub_g1636, partial [Astrephomene gubernaculifera]